MAISDAQLSKLIEENNFLPIKDLKKAIANSTSKSIPLTQSLLDLDLISDQNLGRIIADFLKLPFIELSKVSIKKDILKIIPQEIASKQLVIAYSLDSESLKLAVNSTDNSFLIKNIAKKAGRPVALYYATKKDIQNTLSHYKDELQISFNKLFSERFGKEFNLTHEFPIKETVDLLIEYAYAQRTSDIHIEPENNEVLVRFRVDGILHDVLKGPRQLHDQIITRIKVLSKLRTDEHLSAQDGKMRALLPEEELDIRVSIVPIVEGEKAVLRLLSSKSRQFGLSDLGMSSTDLEKVKQAIEKPYGMIFSTGPTGSGKTTTIYSLLKILNTREKNIATIEDPVEYEMDGINQIQVNDKTNLTFAAGLRSILRQDPDIIFVGEVRDGETAGIAINSAMTGHLVLSSLHTNDAATAVPRLIDLKVEPFLVASTINVIIAQRLARKICESCRVSLNLNKEDLSRYLTLTNVQKFLGENKSLRVYHGKGCSVCHNTGYLGRIGVFEVMTITPAIQELITKKADNAAIVKKAIEEGMTTMFDDGMAKVTQGITTLEEIIRAVKE